MNKLIIFFLILFLNIANANELLIDKTIAIIDDEVILKSDIDFIIKICKIENFSIFNRLNLLDLKKEILKQLIINKIIYKIFSGENIIINNEKINNYINNISNNTLLKKEEFIKILYSNGIDINLYKNFIKNKLIIKKIFKEQISPLIKISNEELNECIFNINNNNKINNLFLKYNIDVIKIFNNKKYNFNSIKNIKKIILNLLKNKKHTYDNIKISKNLFIKNIKITNIKNTLCKDLPTIIFSNIINKENCYDMIGPIYINNFTYFIKVNSIKKLSKTNIIKEVNISNFFIDEINNNNKYKNFNEINNFYNKIISNKINYVDIKNCKNEFFNKIKILNLGWKNINNYDNFLKYKIINLKNKELSKPFLYKNKWNIFLLNDSRRILYDDYIKEKWAKKFILKNKSLFFVKNIINNFKKYIYIKILDKLYYIDI